MDQVQQLRRREAVGLRRQAQVERVESAFVGVGLYGYDRGIDLTRDATLTVLDVNGEPYDNFTVTLEAAEAFDAIVASQ
mgnify:CR=1 FL=1